MDICEYVEKVYGVKLHEYQKRLLLKMKDLKSEDIKIVYGRRGPHAVAVNKDGLKSKVFIVDELNRIKEE